MGIFIIKQEVESKPQGAVVEDNGKSLDTISVVDAEKVLERDSRVL